MKRSRWWSDFSVHPWWVKLLIVGTVTAFVVAIEVGSAYYFNMRSSGHLPPYTLQGAVAGGIIIGLFTGAASVLSKGAGRLLGVGIFGVLMLCGASCLRSVIAPMPVAVEDVVR